VIEDRDKKITIQAGECAFIRRNHRLLMYKNSKGYNKLSKNNLPKKAPLSDKNVFKIDARADITSLFQSLVPYFDEKLKPSDGVAQLKSQECIYALLNNSEIFL